MIKGYTMKKVKTVNVLGTEYTVRRVDKDQDEYMEKMHLGGYCDDLRKEIVILNYKSLPEWENEPDERLKVLEATTMRHELIHAFLNESGLKWNAHDDEKAWAKNEEMVDWFANQMPKIIKAFKEADCL